MAIVTCVLALLALGCPKASLARHITFLTSTAGVTPPLDASKHRFIPASYSSCRGFFLDLGANRGDSILRWYDNEWVGREGTDLHKRMRSALRDQGGKSLPPPRDFCTLSFEGNPRWTEALRAIERNKRQEGRRVRVFTKTVVSNTTGKTSLFLDGSSEHGYGSSIFADKSVNVVQTVAGRVRKMGKRTLGKAVEVDSVDLSELVAEVIALQPEAALVIKMDIEGAEVRVGAERPRSRSRRPERPRTWPG